MRWWKISNICKIKIKLNETDSQNQEWDESYTCMDCEDKWLLLIHRFHRQMNVADPQTSDARCCISTGISDGWMLHPQISDTAVYCTSIDIADSWRLQIHKYRKQLDVAYPQISQTAGCYTHRYLTQLDTADLQISQTGGCCNPQISQTAGCCRSTDISEGWMLHPHISDTAGYCRSTDIANSWMLQIQRYLR